MRKYQLTWCLDGVTQARLLKRIPSTHILPLQRLSAISTADFQLAGRWPLMQARSVMENSELDELMRATRMRVIHIVSFIGLVMLLISYKAITSSSFTLREIPNLAGWFVGCAGFIVASTWWYRARLRAIEGFRTTIEQNTTIYSTSMTDFRVYFIPVGCGVHMEIDDRSGGASRCSLGFWTRPASERLLHLLRNNPRASAPPATIEVALPTRTRGGKIPKAVAVTKSDSE